MLLYQCALSKGYEIITGIIPILIFPQASHSSLISAAGPRPVSRPHLVGNIQLVDAGAGEEPRHAPNIGIKISGHLSVGEPQLSWQLGIRQIGHLRRLHRALSRDDISWKSEQSHMNIYNGPGEGRHEGDVT